VSDLETQLYDLAVANRILAREGIVDAFGHVSIRHPHHPERYILSRSRSPELVCRSDMVEYGLDNEPIHDADKTPERKGYAERPIHGGIYETRPDVMAVVHHHAHSVIPFGVTGRPMQQILHVAGGIVGPLGEVPVWDIRDRFGDTNMLVTTRDQGLDLAQALGDGGAVLMRGHGATTAADTLIRAVHLAIYLSVNAELLTNALNLGGDLVTMSPGEIAETDAMNGWPIVQERTWEYWKDRADLSGI